MTRVQARYLLEGPLDQALLSAVARAHSIYGIQGVQVASPPDAVLVEYDASRLTPKQVISALLSIGLPVRSEAPR